MKYFILVLIFASAPCVLAAHTKTVKHAQSILTPTQFDGVGLGVRKSAVEAKGFRCRNERIGDYMTLHECRRALTFADEPVQAYATLDDGGVKTVAVGFDALYPGDDIGGAQKKFYKFVTAVQQMLDAQPAVTKTPDTYIALTNFVFPKTIVSCYLYSDDRTQPAQLRCGCEIRSRK